MLAYFASLCTKSGSAINALGNQPSSNDIRNNGVLASNSIIKDANFAEESLQLAKSKIMQNFTTTMLQQTKKIRKDFLLGVYGLI